MDEILNKIEKYNPWQGKLFNTGFKRQAYLDKILKYHNNKLIKVITGQRRSGKSYLLRQIMNYLIENKYADPKNIFYFNNEYMAFDQIKEASDLENLFNLYKEKISGDGKKYIFLDEIQNIAGWEKFANSYSQDFTEEYELYITGSNSNLLSGELATYLSGRYVNFELFPFDFEEYCDFKKLDRAKNSFTKYLKDSGLPEMFNFNDEELKRHYTESLVNTIILRDIVARYSIKDVDLLNDIFRFLVVNIGSLTSYNNIVNYFKSLNKKTNYETVSTYVDYLKNTFIVKQVDRYNIRGKKILGSERKFYINDFAFKNFMLGFYPQDIGNYLENYVYRHLLQKGYQVNVGILDNKEVDFVAVRGDRKIYVQVSYLLENQKTIDREFGNLAAIKDNYPKYLVTMDDIEFSDYQGIQHIQAWKLDELRI